MRTLPGFLHNRYRRVMNTINHTCRVCDAVIENAGMGTACARCGVRVNAEFWTVRESKPSSVFLLVVGLGLFAIAAREVSFGQWEAHQILILGVCVLVTWMFIANRPNEAVIWKSGVVLLERGAEPRRISWKGVTDVKFNDELDRVEFVGEGGVVIDSISAEFFGTWRRADHFVREARTIFDSTQATDTSRETV